MQNLQARLSTGSAVTASILPASVVASAVSASLVQNTAKYSKELERHANSDVRT